MNDTPIAPRRGRPRKSLFAQKPVIDADSEDGAFVEAAPEAPPRPGRSASKSENPRDRAARRTAEIRNHNNGTLDEGTDEYYIDPSLSPDGGTYEWKMRTVLGKEDPGYDIALRRKGWEPVDAERHPEMMPRNSAEREITRKGMVLMERPKELTDEVNDISRKNARNQVASRAGEIDPKGRGGLMDRSDSKASMKVTKSYSPIAIPD